MRKYRIFSLMMTLYIAVIAVCSGAATASAENVDSVYVKQEGRGYCTLASAVMMMRQKAIDEGNPTWKNITHKSLINTAWLTGQGLKRSFKFYGISVSYSNFDKENIKAQLIDLLESHPEGIEIYDRGVPHAVFLTRYDSDTDIFYCADPGISTSEMKLKDSWLRTIHTSVLNDESLQQAIVDSLDAYWYISEYNSRSIPEFVEPVEITPSNDSKDIVVEAVKDDVETTSSNKNESSKPAPVPKRNPSTADFKDIDSNAWYYDYIYTAYNNGLMNGINDNSFKPEHNITIAQSVTLAARIHSTHNGNKGKFKAVSGEKWYDPYIKYAQKEKIIASRYADKDVMEYTATRAEFAEILNGALPGSALSRINNVKDGDIKDVNLSDPSGKAIYRLFRSGVITGSDSKFNPSESITRAQVAAIVSRMTDPKLRIRL